MSGIPEAFSEEEARRRTLTAARRFRARDAIWRVMEAMVPGDPALASLHRVNAADASRFALLTGLAPDSQEFRTLLEALERSGAAKEQVLLAFDAGIPIDRFAASCRAGPFDSGALADYAALLGAAVGTDLPGASDRVDRIELLLSRVSRVCGDPPQGPPGIEIREAVDAVLPRGNEAPEFLDGALTWFTKATRQAEDASSLEALIESGFFVELRTFKSSQGRALLAPAVMALSVELRQMIAQIIQMEAKGDASESAALWRHLELAEAQARRRVDALRPATMPPVRPERPAPFVRRVVPESATRTRQKTKVGESPHRRRPRRLGALAIGAALAVLIAGLWLQQSGGANMRALSADERSALTPLLTEASLVPAQNPRVLVGRFERAAWAKVPREDRQGAARALAAQLASRGLASATVMVDTTVAVQIEQGQILIVE